MKKTLTTIAVLMAIATTAAAQTTPTKGAQTTATNDTTLVNASAKVRFFSQTSPDGKVQYFAEVDGETYSSNKTSAQRFAVTRRFGGQPNVILIESKKTQRRRISVL